MATRNTTRNAGLTRKKKPAGLPSVLLSIGSEHKSFPFLKQLLTPLLENSDAALLITNPLPEAVTLRLTEWLKLFKFNVRTAKDKTKTSARTLYLTPRGVRSFILDDVIRLEELNTPKEAKQKQDRLDAVLYDLNERIKEQACLYGITKLAATAPGLDELLHGAVKLIPKGWQYPSHTCCSIIYNKAEFRSAGFRKTRWNQLIERDVQAGGKLVITVYYKKKMPDADEGPFLKYERSLLNSIADSLILYISQLLVKSRSRQSESMLKEAQELALLGNWSYDLLQKKSYWSDSVYDIFGVSRQQIRQSFGAFFNQVSKEDRKRVETTMRKARREGGDFSLDYCILTPAGEKKYIEEFGYSEKDKKGRVIRLFGTVQDISQRMKAEQKLSDSEYKYRSLFEASPVPSYIFDLHTHRILDVNKRMTEQYGYTRDELLSMTILDIRPKEQIPRLHEQLEKANRVKGVIHFGVMTHQNKDGSLKQVDISGEQIRIGDSDCMLVLAHDISEKMMQQEMDHLERNIIEKSLKSKTAIDIILKDYLTGLEELITGLSASILRVSEGKVYNWASPSLPLFYAEALNGLAIGPEEGSCGTAAYTGKQIIVSDIRKSNLWKKYKKLALSAGLRASWSTPVFNPEGKVIATFANYYKEIRMPSPFELEIFNRAAVLISILIESYEQDQRLQRSHERFGFVTKATSEAIWDWNLVTDKVFCGDGFNTILGVILKEQEWRLSVWLEYIHPDDRMLITQKVESVLQGKENRWELEYRIIRKKGQLVYVSDRAYIIRNNQGRPIRIIGAIRDITVKREEEQQLRLLESVVTNTSDAVVITRADLNTDQGPEIIYVNEAFSRMTGYSPAEVIGKTPALLQGPKSDWAEMNRLSLALKRGEPCSVNIINYTKSGKEYRVEMMVKPVFDANHRITHFFAIQRDITTQFKLQQQRRFMEMVSSTFKKIEGLVISLDSVLKKLVEFGDFTAAETWLLTADKQHLSLVASFASTKASKDYYAENKALNTLTPDGGLLKEVWARRELVIVDDFDKHASLRRRAGVQKAGFKSALAIPLMNRGELIGVLAVLTDKPSAHLSEFEQLFRGLEADLGSEIKRKQLENELSLIFNTAPDIIAVVGFDGYFKRINPAAYDILGYSIEELLSRPYNEFIHQDYISATNSITATFPSISGSNYFENCYITKSGKSVWLGWTYQQIPGEDLVYTVAKDITRQKELQRLLHDATSLARIGAWEMELPAMQIIWSDVTREIHEVEPGYQPVLQEIYQFYQDSDKSRLEESVLKAIGEGIPYDLELLHVTAKGNQRWVRVIGTPEMANGKCLRIYGSFQDIHARKLAEIELQQRTRYLSAIATVAQIFLSNENWFDGIKNSFDLARYTIMADQIFYKEIYTDKETGQSMYRQRIGWLKGKDMPAIDPVETEVLPIDSFQEVKEVLLSDQPYMAVLSELPDNLLRQVLVHSGIKSVLFLPVFAGSVLEGVVGVEECYHERRWAEGEIFFMRSLCSSLSSAIQRFNSSAAQKKLNEDLVRQTRELKISNTELEQFAYVASHDLQEPLRMITSFLTKLEDRYAIRLDDRGRRYIDFAVDGANRMRQNILGLLQYSRVGKGNAAIEEIDLNMVVEEIRLLHQTDINETGAVVEVAELPVINNYMAPVVQLMNNLVSNALKYRKPDTPPVIRISARPVEEYWEIAISDNGIGIEKEYLQKIFVIFQRLHPKDQYEGTGIGLAVVKKIVENLGGKVWVESDPGIGSTFYFTIRSIKD